MSIYPGNPALGDEVKQRIVATYEQSLELAERGRREEALLGCDFVLELDPQFAPARALRDRLAGAATAAPTLPDLEAEKVEDRPGSPPVPAGEAWSGSPPAADLPEESFEALFDLDALDLLDLDEQPAAPPLAAAVRERLEAPDYREAHDRAGAEPEAITADPEAARIAAAAQARLEAQPYVESFLKEAGTALRAGDGERARMMLDKARSLDPGHPLLADLDAAASAGEEAERSGTAEGADAPEGANAAEGVEGADAAEGAEPAEVLGGFELPEPLASEEAPLTAANPPAAAGGDGRIGELLAEGQGAADRGDYQGAIDSWSRIFLIDVDHEEAARRIEEARRSKAEREREVEEVFHEGLTALDRGDGDTARSRFERVLAVQPNHLVARDYLRQMESGEPVRVAAGPSADDTVAMGGLGSFDLADLGAPREGATPPGELKEEILVPPPPGGLPADQASAPMELPSYGKAAVGRDSGRRTFLLVGGLVLALVVGAAALVFVNKDRWFPNSDVKETAAAAPEAAGAPGSIERAAGLQERGQTAMALGLLRRIRPDDPRYEEAQELISRWETPVEAAPHQTLAPETQARRERLLAAAGAAFENGEYLLSEELIDRAARIAVLEGENLELGEAVKRQLAPLGGEIALFREGEYELLLPRLWRRYQAEPDNRDLRRMLVNSYYNRSVRLLQRGDPAGAARELREALELAPGDEDLQRHLLFAQAYESRPRDLLYRIYVKYLPLR